MEREVLRYHIPCPSARAHPLTVPVSAHVWAFSSVEYSPPTVRVISNSWSILGKGNVYLSALLVLQKHRIASFKCHFYAVEALALPELFGKTLAIVRGRVLSPSPDWVTFLFLPLTLFSSCPSLFSPDLSFSSPLACPHPLRVVTWPVPAVSQGPSCFVSREALPEIHRLFTSLSPRGNKHNTTNSRTGTPGTATWVFPWNTRHLPCLAEKQWRKLHCWIVQDNLTMKWMVGPESSRLRPRFRFRQLVTQ